MTEVQVFQMNEYGAVAAKSEKQAKNFYMETTGLDQEDAFPDEISVVPLETLIWYDETLENKVSLNKIVEEYWRGSPFIATTTEW